MRKVAVTLGDRSYEILIGAGLLRKLGEHYVRLGLGTRCAIITDSNVAPRYLSIVQRSLEAKGIQCTAIQVPAGETSKSLKSVERCYNALAEHRLERKSCIVALGGGVVGDLAGFVAATYLRGIPFIQIPTTLLSQVDSSVGGKTGVNLKAGKNLVGAFYQPRLVLCDLDTLTSLPKREFRAGLAEVIKYGIIQDPKLFRQLEQAMPKILKRDRKWLTHLVARSCEIKADVVIQDETESGLRATLNFGHTIGHALEAISGYGTLLHGEAISIGQVAAARLSAEGLGLPETHVDRIRSLFRRAGLPTSIRISTAQRSRMIQAMMRDKKVSGGEVKFVLAEQIGSVKWGQRVPLERLQTLPLE